MKKRLLCLPVALFFYALNSLAECSINHYQGVLNVLIIVDDDVEPFIYPQTDSLYLYNVAHFFKHKNHNVEILYTQNSYNNILFPDFKALQLPQMKDLKIKGTTDKIQKMFRLYRHLKNKEYDIIVYRISDGWGYYLTQAKLQGYAFKHSTLVGLLTPIKDWRWYNNNETPKVPDAFIESHLEEKTILYSDIILYPSVFSYEYLKRNIPLKENIAPFIKFEANTSIPNQDKPNLLFDEIIFIGTNSFVQGSDIFEKTMQKFQKANPLLFNKTKITVLTPQDTHVNFSKEFKNKIQFFKFGDEKSLKDYLSSGKKIIISCSRSQWYDPPSYYFDNGNLVVKFNQFPNQKLKDPLIEKSQQDFFNTTELSRKIIDILQKKALSDHTSKQRLQNTSTNFYTKILNIIQETKIRSTAPEKNDAPLISVCVTHYNRPDQLMELLKSLEKQTYKNFEVLIIDDESSKVNIKILKEKIEPYLKKMVLSHLFKKNSRLRERGLNF